MPSQVHLASTPSPRPALRLKAQTVLVQLERSLERSRRALLSRDLAGIERETAEQRALVLQLEATMRTLMQDGPGSTTDTPSWENSQELDLIEKIRLSQKRVWMAARVQAGLLVRAQTRLRMLAHLLAGPGANYGPFAPAWGSSFAAQNSGAQKQWSI